MYFKEFFVKNENPAVQKFSPRCVKILFRARMFLMKSNKILFASIFLFCLTSCGFWQTAENTNTNAPQISEEIKTGIPFESKEPETFQTEIIITSFLNGEKTEKVYFAARTGNKSLTIFNRGEKTEHSVLTDGGKTFFFNTENKTFRETENTSGAVSSGDEMSEFLTSLWLNRKTDAKFEKSETENNLTNYRITPENSAASEIILTYDENLKMPVKQEFYSVSGEEKTLTMTVELRNFQPSADEKLFVLPQDYKRAETK
jgi:outer membrane lipoprotein-sorting protein